MLVPLNKNYSTEENFVTAVSIDVTADLRLPKYKRCWKIFTIIFHWCWVLTNKIYNLFIQEWLVFAWNLNLKKIKYCANALFEYSNQLAENENCRVKFTRPLYWESTLVRTVDCSTVQYSRLLYVHIKLGGHLPVSLLTRHCRKCDWSERTSEKNLKASILYVLVCKYQINRHNYGWIFVFNAGLK